MIWNFNSHENFAGNIIKYLFINSSKYCVSVKLKIKKQVLKVEKTFYGWGGLISNTLY